MFRSCNDYIGGILFKTYDNRAFNTTGNITKHISNYSNGVTNGYKTNNINNVRETCYNFIGDIVLNKTSNTYTGGTYNVTKNNNLFNATGNQYFTKKINNTSNTTNNVTNMLFIIMNITS